MRSRAVTSLITNGSSGGQSLERSLMVSSRLSFSQNYWEHKDPTLVEGAGFQPLQTLSLHQPNETWLNVGTCNVSFFPE
jgi:hypothetical protein